MSASERFSAKAGRIAMLGYSLGGYFVTRAAGYENRLGAVIASTPLPNAGLGLGMLATVWRQQDTEREMSTATRRNVDVIFWKMGASSDEEFIAKAQQMIADPALVTLPFLSIIGTGEGPAFQMDGKHWHETIPSKQNTLSSWMRRPALTGTARRRTGCAWRRRCAAG